MPCLGMRSTGWWVALLVCAGERLATAAPGDCGYPGQRECCIGDPDRNYAGSGACAPGAHGISGCTMGAACHCGGASTWATGTCVSDTPTPCGHAGERACCGGDTTDYGGGACHPDLTEVVGCPYGPTLCACSSGPASAISRCVENSPCGQPGQRGCCALDPMKSHTTPGPCVEGYVLQDLCDDPDECVCPNTGAPDPFRCMPITPCGASGQRACCGPERGGLNAMYCDPGNVQVPGCAGNCRCGSNGDIESNGTCTPWDGEDHVVREIAEPETGWTKPVEEPACKMRGYADLHLHLFGHLANGGIFMHGRPFDETNGATGALDACFATDDDLSGGGPAACPSWYPDCGAYYAHGYHTIFDNPSFGGTGEDSGDLFGFGAPTFSVWPRSRSTAHQQAYWKWLERAWRGGLRLVSMLAVTNEAMCRSSRRLTSFDCLNSMASIDAQLAMAREFEAFVDDQNDGDGWFRIVENASDARRAVRAGKLAVVLGIEVDNLFGCKEGDPQCTAQHVTDKVEEYRARGIRHVFPIHNFDNAFGGAATWNQVVAVGQRAVEGRWWEIEDCESEGYGLMLGNGLGVSGFLGFGALLIIGFGIWDAPPWGPPIVACNRRGLTGLGTHLLTELRGADMLIDIDHMSRRSIADTVAWSKANGGYPLIASHVLLFDQATRRYEGSRGSHERMRTQAQLAAVRDSGGTIGLMLKDDVVDGDNFGMRATHTLEPALPDDCRHSSTTILQGLVHANKLMKGPVAFGSDFNGVAGHVGPRFGTKGCGEDEAEQVLQEKRGAKVTYPFSTPGFGTFEPQRTGQRVFDYNDDGLAHVGLLPDLVEDLNRLGLPAENDDLLFRSAEAFIETWERAEMVNGAPPRLGCHDLELEADANCEAVLPTPSFLHETVLDDPDAAIGYTPPGTLALGTHTVGATVGFATKCEPGFECTADVTVVDRTPPTLTCPSFREPIGCPDPGLGGTDVFWPATVSTDNCSGTRVDYRCSREPGFFPEGATTVTCSSTDGAGNTSECAFVVTVQCGPSIAPDAGHGDGSPPGGCGCAAQPGVVPLGVAALALLRRRRGRVGGG